MPPPDNESPSSAPFSATKRCEGATNPVHLSLSVHHIGVPTRYELMSFQGRKPANPLSPEKS